MTFYQRLVAETIDGQMALASVPQIQDGLMGRISRETYIAYLTEAYHHVKHTVPLMQTARARMDENHQRFVAALDEYIAEETGHEHWILSDIKNCGGDMAAARDAAPGAATQAMTDYAYDYIKTVNPMGFFGMVFVLEGTSVALALDAAERIQQALRLPDAAFSYLRSHGTLDREHTRHLAELLERMAPEDQEEVIRCAKVFFRLYAEIFRALPA